MSHKFLKLPTWDQEEGLDQMKGVQLGIALGPIHLLLQTLLLCAEFSEPDG